MRKINAPLLLTAGLLGLGLVGCTPIVATRGNMVEPERLAKVQPGVTTREQVQYTLGSPTATGTLDPNTWYYIGRRTEQTAFFAPDLAEQRVYRVRFDDAGMVKAVDEMGREQARAIDPEESTTPTMGRDVGILEQVLGTLGGPTKKKKDDKKKGRGGG
ncbi:outer membrane protein assembly factor BamE [Aerophototrophica crusticola]|uniref:Outer membrane protein assembly factor BamE n=1 Tax=Aerophototrophica crusticola TaxID=1709002 RepID=A0A858R5L8_9PROT|nr:outer membrane protein assembly factor BamE [Rhodospirillaceae bacterium B3]